MMRLPELRSVFCFLVVLVPLGCAESERPKPERPAPLGPGQTAFMAFVNDEPGLLSDRLMTEQRYQRLLETDRTNWSRPRPSEAELKEAARRAVTSFETSFRGIRRVLTASGFDWQSARLTSVETVIYQGGRSRRVPYDDKRTERRLDIWLRIEADEKTILLALDDCFLVDGERYLGDGFRLWFWFGFSLDAKTMAEMGWKGCEPATNPERRQRRAVQRDYY